MSLYALDSFIGTSAGSMPISTGPETSLSDKIGAQFQLENIVGSFALQHSDKPLNGFQDDEDFNPGSYINDLGLEGIDEIKRFGIIHDAGSSVEADHRLSVYDKELKNREIVASMSTWEGLWTGALAGFTDPIVLATTAVPLIRAGMSIGKVAGRLGALGAAEQAVIEVGLHAQQYDRTLSESAINTGANAVLGGILGGVGSKFFGTSRTFSGDVNEQKVGIAGALQAEADIPIRDVINAYHRGEGPVFNNSRSSVEVDVHDPQNMLELEALIRETDPRNKGFLRRVGAFFMNPVSRALSQFSSLEGRLGMSDLTGGGMITEGNVRTGGTAGTATGAGPAIERASGVFTGMRMRPLLSAYKEWMIENGKRFDPNRMKQGMDPFLEEVSTIMRTWGQAEATAPKWAKELVPKLLKADELYENHLIRLGWFDTMIQKSDDVVSSIDKVKLSLRKIEAENLKKKTSGRDKKINELKATIKANEKRLKLLQGHEAGNLEDTKVLIKDLHGDNNYLTQSHNSVRATHDRDGWISTMRKAEELWYTRRLKELKDAGRTYEYGELNRAWKQILSGLKKSDKDGVDGRYEIIHKEITERSDEFNLGGIDSQLGRNPSQGKARELRIDQEYAKLYLKNNYMDLQSSHMSAVLPHLELKRVGMLPGSDEFKARQARARKQVEMLKKGKSVKEQAKLENMHQQTMKDWENVQEVLLHQNYNDVSQGVRDFGFVMQSFNAVRQLGAMLIASIGDVPGTIVKTGLPNIGRAIKPWTKSIGRDFNAKEAKELVGIVELVSASRMHALQNSAELGINQGATARIMGRISQQFYKASGILYWNQGMKELAVFGMMDRILRASVNPKKMKKADRMWFARDGWDEAKLKRLAELHSRYSLKQDSTNILNTGRIYEEWGKANASTRAQLDADAQLADEFNAFLKKHSDRSIVTPGAGDFPTFLTKHPVFKLIGQYKGFGMASMNKTSIPMIQGMMAGDGSMAFGFLGLTVFGSGAYMLRQKMYDREITENWETIAYEGMLRGGALGLYSDGLAISQKVSNNWLGLGDALNIETPSRYYARGVVTDVLGPSAGLIEDIGYSFHSGSKALKGEEITDTDKAKALRMMPFNNLFYLRAFLERY